MADDDLSETTPLLTDQPALRDEAERQPKSQIGELWCKARYLNGSSSDEEANSSTHLESYPLASNQYKPLSLYHFRHACKLGFLCVPSFFKFIIRLMPWTLLTTILTSVTSGILPTFTTYLSAQLLDEVQKSLQFGNPNIPRIKMLAIITIAIAFFRVGFQYVTRRTERLLSRTLDVEVQRIYNQASLALDIPSLQEPYRRDILEGAQIFAGGAQAIDRQGQRSYNSNCNSFINNFTSIIEDVVTLASSFLLLVRTIVQRSSNARDMHIQMGLAFIAMIPSIIGLLATLTTDRNKQRWSYPLHRRQWALEKLTAPDHRKEIILFQLRDWVLNEWTKVTRQIAEERPLMGQWRWLEKIMNISGPTCINTTFSIFLALRTFGDALTLGSANLLQSVAKSFISSIESLYQVAESAYQTIFFLAAFLEASNLQPIIRRRENSEKEDKVVFRPMEGEKGFGVKLEIRNLSFKYPTAKQYALKNINMTIQPGETVAIVGFNGGGKTTLLQCLLRLFTYEGTFLINDIDAKEYDPIELYKSMSACFQELSKYPVKLRENIICGNLDRADDAAALEKAVEDGGITDFLPELTEGLDTFLNVFPEAQRNNAKAKSKDEISHPEQSLSGGQWQRVALARAFIKVPDSLLAIFDEPSAALDPAAEHALFERISQLSTGSDGRRTRTTIFVTHRFNTVRKADKIGVFDKGQITEFGTHEELMTLGGTYHQFFETQASAFR